MASLHLTESRYAAGLQCLRRLWLLVHEPQDHGEPPGGSPLAIGQQIGHHARSLFPGGVLIAEDPRQYARAIVRTAVLVADTSVPAIFEAAFVHDDVRVRVDVLERHAEGWGLREVKSSSRVKDHHLDDVALQAHVLAGSGVSVRSAEVLHVNTRYVRETGDVDWSAFFVRADVADAVEARRVDLPAHLLAMHDCLQLDAAPHVEPGAHCHVPYGCEFWDRCTATKPADWITYLPRLNAARTQELDALGITAISAIPPAFPLTAKQVIIRDATVSGQPYVAPDLGHLLQRFGPPARYLDFEAMMPPIPLYEGTCPYQTLPFQWSLHVVAADGALRPTTNSSPAARATHGGRSPKR